MLSPPKPWETSNSALNRQGLDTGTSGTGAVSATTAAPSPYVRPYTVAPYYGGAYGGMLPDAGFGGFLQPQMAALANLHMTVGMIGAMTELLAANASNALQVARGALSFVEQVGQSAGEAIGLLREHPLLDPTMGRSSTQLESHPNSTTFVAHKRKRTMRWLLGSIAVLGVIWALKFVLRSDNRDAGGRRIGRNALLLLALLGGAYAGHRGALLMRQAPEADTASATH